jgi:hypothetical protein
VPRDGKKTPLEYKDTAGNRDLVLKPRATADITNDMIGDFPLEL